MLDQIAEFKHHLLKGGDLDYDRTCFAIIDDFRKGRLGKITLDKA
jgi:ribosome biogenesis GTPase A